MRSISDQDLIKITFIFSLLAHSLFLGTPGFLNSVKPQLKKDEETNVRIKIEKPPLLPKINVLGEEKKLKEIEHQITKTPEHQLEKKEEIIEELQEIEEEPKPKEQIEKEIVKQPQSKPSQGFIEVINPQEEAMLRYQDMVKQKIESCRRYPNWAKKQGFEGSVYLKFTILSTGFTKDIKIIKSSGFNILDKEAISTIKRAQPFPPIPEEMKVSSLTMEVSVVFTLQ